jgi:hypothetical protein
VRFGQRYHVGNVCRTCTQIKRQDTWAGRPCHLRHRQSGDVAPGPAAGHLALPWGGGAGITTTLHATHDFSPG